MTKLTHSVLDRIKREQRAPLPRWQFVARRAAVWTLVVTAILAAGMFFGSTVAGLIQADWRLIDRWPGAAMGFLHDTISWLFVTGFIAAIIAAAAFFRLTRHGYRYGIAIIGGIVAIAGLTAGGLLIPTGMPDRVHAWHEEQLPPPFEISRFHAPAAGRLVGELTAIEHETATFTAVDGRTWELWLFGEVPEFAAVGASVAAFGEPIDDTTFAVFSLRPTPPAFSMQDVHETVRMLE